MKQLDKAMRGTVALLLTVFQCLTPAAMAEYASSDSGAMGDYAAYMNQTQEPGTGEPDGQQIYDEGGMLFYDYSDDNPISAPTADSGSPAPYIVSGENLDQNENSDEGIGDVYGLPEPLTVDEDPVIIEPGNETEETSGGESGSEESEGSEESSEEEGGGTEEGEAVDGDDLIALNAPNQQNLTLSVDAPDFPEAPVEEPADLTLPAVPPADPEPTPPTQTGGGAPNFPSCPGDSRCEAVNNPGVYKITETNGNVTTIYLISTRGLIFDVPNSLGMAKADRIKSVSEYGPVQMPGMMGTTPMQLRGEMTYYDSTNDKNIYRTEFRMDPQTYQMSGSETMNWLSGAYMAQMLGVSPEVQSVTGGILESWTRDRAVTVSSEDPTQGRNGTITSWSTIQYRGGIQIKSFNKQTLASGAAVALKNESWSSTESRTTNDMQEVETVRNVSSSTSELDSAGDLVSQISKSNYFREKQINRYDGVTYTTTGTIKEDWQSSNNNGRTSKDGYIKLENTVGDTVTKNVTIFSGNDSATLNKTTVTRPSFDSLELFYENRVRGNVDTITISKSSQRDSDNRLLASSDSRSNQEVNAQGVTTLNKSWSDSYSRNLRISSASPRDETQAIEKSRSFSNAINTGSNFSWSLKDEERRASIGSGRTYKTIEISLSRSGQSHSVEQSSDKAGVTIAPWGVNPTGFGGTWSNTKRKVDGNPVMRDSKWLSQDGRIDNRLGSWGAQQWLAAMAWFNGGGSATT